MELIEKYGIILQRLEEGDIELVRTWRNDPKIAQHMIFRDYITPEMQSAWFKKINNNENYYFLVIKEGKKVGLVNIKDIDYNSKCGEIGIFIYEDKYLNSIFPYRGFLGIHDFVFTELDLYFTYAKILKNNHRALSFIKSIGYDVDTTKYDDNIGYYTLLKENYLVKSQKIKKMVTV